MSKKHALFNFQNKKNQQQFYKQELSMDNSRRKIQGPYLMEFRRGDEPRGRPTKP